ncbi:xanthine dehydrogenase [Sedimentitalea sp. CY04]|uniref:Xanthine dehydrogenase n=1 Tax=Parasedimentitalea denitrificans TaxID=2211118 RepID=A0ABX0W7E4_9RHOB|nr:FAD binding domain-containing protein [Sedimentitalea sp. CY04]NIZ61522.1 xanthine dehydrogenase [Sedimentitalea sp. CY04]
MAYFAPTALNDALSLLASEDVSIIAGGSDVFPARGQAPMQNSLLDVTRIEGLAGLQWGPNGLRIGAATRWSEIIKADLPDCYAGLQAAARTIGSVQIQNSGTIAGNICNASPAADGMPPLITLGATVEITGPDGVRRMPVDEFVTGPRQTHLRAGELVTAIHVPPLPGYTRGAFEKLGSRSYLVISITMVAVVIGCDATGRIDFARVAVGACSPVAKQLTGLEADLIGKMPQQIQISTDHLAPLAPITDIRADAGYRLDAVAEQIKRAVGKAAISNG